MYVYVQYVCTYRTALFVYVYVLLVLGFAWWNPALMLDGVRVVVRVRVRVRVEVGVV